MLVISIAAAVVAATFVVLAAFLIPAIIELRKTTVAARRLIVSTESELDPALKELRQILMQVRDITDSASAGVEEAKHFMAAVGETGRILHSINGAVGGISGLFGKSGLWSAAAVAAGEYFYKKIKKRRNKRDDG